MSREALRRRTFGIISHPDAGKTTLTEKLLLFGGAIQMAGAVKAKKAQRHATSDWMEVERERGISIALGFAHCTTADDCTIDLIDMPGHERFVHTMVAGATGIDAVLLVVAANEGIKPQTIEHIDIAGLLGLRQTVAPRVGAWIETRITSPTPIE